MSTTQTPKTDAASGVQTPSATVQEKRTAPAEMTPQSAYRAAVKNRGALGAGGILALQAAVGNRAVVGMIQAKQGRSSTEERDERSKVHEAAKVGIGGTSGELPHLATIQKSFGRHDVTGVVAHTGTQATVGAQAMGAAAFTMGNHVAFAGSADLHTAAHEAAHVVQQRAGVQLAGGVGQVGDRYEQHADAVAGLVVQGASAETLLDRYAGSDPAPRAYLSAPAQGADAEVGTEPVRPVQLGVASRDVVQRVRGGLEFTENHNPGLESFAVPALPVAGPVARSNSLTTHGNTVSAFVVPGVANLGAPRTATTFTLLTAGAVSLTNDETSAEWIIARHGADVTPAAMRQNITGDIAQLFAMRDDLADFVNTLQGINAGQVIALSRGLIASLDVTGDPPGVFVYTPGNSRGTAQITVQYTNAEAIKRINLLNASKYLPGTKVAPGEDVQRVTGTEGWGLQLSDVLGGTSFSQAGVLLAALTASSHAIVDAALPAPPVPVVTFTQAQVALVKLMVLNDAMAATMTRYAALIGEAHEKNIQRFFPKSRRDEYSRAVARGAINAPTFLALRAEINRTRAADALLYFDMTDPAALRTNETLQALGLGADTTRITTTAGRLGVGAAVDPADIAHLKAHVLGPNGAHLATWIGRGALAYTDTSAVGVNTDHVQGGGLAGNVISSTQGLTPVARAAPNDVGAVYEFREREIPVDDPNWAGTVNGSAGLIAALDALFAASD
ncbi:MAG TPA: DUF4157 domain-containing protein [Kofleriaceae bacterium]